MARLNLPTSEGVKTVLALFAVVLVTGVLAWPARTSDAQGEPILQAVAVGGIIPVMVGDFDTREVGATNPLGIAYNTSTKEYAIVDSEADEVFIVDNKGKLISQFDTAGLGTGSTRPQGLAYNSAANQYVIVDDTAGAVFSVSPAGVFQSQCDIGGLGITNPSGVAFNSATGELAITDNGADKVFIVTTACALVNSFDTAAGGSLSPSGITYRPDTDQYEVAELGGAEIYIYDASAGGFGSLVNQFDIGASSINSPSGLAYNPDDRVSSILDSGWDQVFPVDYRGTLVSTFDTGAVGARFPTDMSLNTATGDLLITDNSNLVVTTTDAGALIGTCTVIGAFSTNGIAYLPGTDQLAIVDSVNDEISITDTNCGLVSSCDTINIGTNIVAGIGVNEIFGDLMLVDNDDDAIRSTDIAGTLKTQCATTVLDFAAGPVSGISQPQDIAHISSAGNFAVVGSFQDEVIVFNSLCLPVMHFDTSGLPAIRPMGIAINNTTKRIFILDNSALEVYVLDLPRIFEATTLSGTFVSPDVATLNLEEARDGFVFGNVVLSGAAATNGLFGVDTKTHVSGALDASGRFYKATLSLIIMVVFPGPAPSTFVATVSSDLNTISVGGNAFVRQ